MQNMSGLFLWDLQGTDSIQWFGCVCNVVVVPRPKSSMTSVSGSIRNTNSGSWLESSSQTNWYSSRKFSFSTTYTSKASEIRDSSRLAYYLQARSHQIVYSGATTTLTATFCQVLLDGSRHSRLQRLSSPCCRTSAYRSDRRPNTNLQVSMC